MSNLLEVDYDQRIGGFNMPTFYTAPVKNFVQKTLSGTINGAVQTITLSSTTDMQFPGYIVVDRVDSSNTATPTLREVITYTGITGSNLTGCARGADGSTAQAHGDQAVVETVPTIGMWNSLTTIVASGLDSNGYLKGIASPVSIAQLYGSAGFLSTLTVTGLLNVANASVVGIASQVARKQTAVNGLISLASTNSYALVTSLGLDSTFSTKLGKITWNAPFNWGSSTHTFQFSVNADVVATETFIGGDGGGFQRPWTYAFLATLASGATVRIDWKGNDTFDKPSGSDSFLIAEQ